MSEIEREITANCAYSMAPELIQRFFEQHLNDGKTPIVLRAPGLGLGLPGPAAQHEAAALLTRSSAADEEYGAFAHFEIGWEPNDHRYPAFAGSLRLVAADDTYRTTSITLHGTYQPPYGVAGAAFDAVLGHRIAESTADALLDEIAKQIEKDYDEIEERKRVARVN